MLPLAKFFEDPAESMFDRCIDLHINIDHVLQALCANLGTISIKPDSVR